MLIYMLIKFFRYISSICQTKICDGMEIIVGRKESTGTKEDSMVVLTNGGNVSEKFNEHVNEHVNRNVVLKEETANESEKVESNEDTLAACDIGTTTVVCYLIDKETGQIISTRSGANPQRSFGADVLSRIDAAARPYSMVLSPSPCIYRRCLFHRTVFLSLQCRDCGSIQE